MYKKAILDTRQDQPTEVCVCVDCAHKAKKADKIGASVKEESEWERERKNKKAKIKKEK